MNSTLTKNQKKTYRKDIMEDGVPVTLIAHIRFDDVCGNGHNSFSITCDRYEGYRQMGEPTVKHPSGKTLWLNACGCLHDEVRAHFSELTPLLKWHLCSTDGPLHGVANAIYHAGDRDCHGLRKGEPSRKTPVRIGEGKERDLDAARRSAVWPDATEEELTAPGLKERLEARLPALLDEFRSDIEALGFTW